MKCAYHPERDAVYRCGKCGELICQECAVSFDGAAACSRCVADFVASGKNADGIVSDKNRGLLPTALLSLMLPGAGHMYLGLMKRGLFIMSAFFVTIYSAAAFGWFCWCLIPVLYTAQAFDAINIRRRLIMGEAVADSVSAFTSFLRRYKAPLLIFAAVLLTSNVTKNIMRGMFERGRHYGVMFAGSESFLPSLVLIVFAAYILSKGKK